MQVLVIFPRIGFSKRHERSSENLFNLFLTIVLHQSYIVLTFNCFTQYTGFLAYYISICLLDTILPCFISTFFERIWFDSPKFSLASFSFHRLTTHFFCFVWPLACSLLLPPVESSFNNIIVCLPTLFFCSSFTPNSRFNCWVWDKHFLYLNLLCAYA